MNYETWKEFYRQIRSDMDLGFERDIDAARALNEYLAPNNAEEKASEMINGSRVVVAGDTDVLIEELPNVDYDYIISADRAGERLVNHGYNPDIHVTDLDGSPEIAAELSKLNCVVVVHAHGDNIDLIKEYISDFDLGNVIGTTQIEPFGYLRNYGGFTDGDRAIFMADEMGADTISTAGFNLNDSSVSPEKKKKLMWGEKLIGWLEEERNEAIL